MQYVLKVHEIVLGTGHTGFKRRLITKKWLLTQPQAVADQQPGYQQYPGSTLLALGVKTFFLASIGFHDCNDFPAIAEGVDASSIQ